MANDTFNGKVLTALSLKADSDLMNVMEEALTPKVEICLFNLEKSQSTEYRFLHKVENPNLELYAKGAIVYDTVSNNLYLIKEDGYQIINYNSSVSPIIVESGTGYRKWSTGELEQWGVSTGTSSFEAKTITMPKSFANTDYTLSINTVFADSNVFTNTSYVGTPAYIADLSGTVTNKEVNSFNISSFSTHTWYAKGTAA